VVTERLVDWQVEEADLSGCIGILKRGSVEARYTHLVAEVVEASLPGDQVLHVLDDEMGKVNVLGIVAGGHRSQTVIDRAHRHAVVAAGAGVGVAVAGRDHVQANRRILDGARPQNSEKQKDARRHSDRHRSAQRQNSTV